MHHRDGTRRRRVIGWPRSCTRLAGRFGVERAAAPADRCVRAARADRCRGSPIPWQVSPAVRVPDGEPSERARGGALRLRRQRRARRGDPPALRGGPELGPRALDGSVRARPAAERRAAPRGRRRLPPRPRDRRRSLEKHARVLRLIHAYRARGHRIADTDPLGVRHDLLPRARSGALRLRQRRPRPRLPRRRPARRPGADAAPDPGAAARHLLPQGRRRVHPHPGSRPQGLAAAPHRGLAEPDAARRPTSACASWRSSRPRSSSSASCTPSSWARSASRWRAPRALIPLLDTIVEDAPAHRIARARARHGAPRAPQRALEHPRQVARVDLLGVRGQPADRQPLRLGRRQVPQGLLQRPRHALGRVGPPLADRQPLAPRGGRPGGGGPRARQADARRRPRGRDHRCRC